MSCDIISKPSINYQANFIVEQMSVNRKRDFCPNSANRILRPSSAAPSTELRKRIWSAQYLVNNPFGKLESLREIRCWWKCWWNFLEIEWFAYVTINDNKSPYFAYSYGCYIKWKWNTCVPRLIIFFVFSFQRSGQTKRRCICLGKDQAFYTSGVRDMIDPPRNKKMNARIVGRSENCSWPAASAVRRVPKCVFQCAVYSLRWNRTASWSAVAGQLPKSCFVIPMKHFLPADYKINETEFNWIKI